MMKLDYLKKYGGSSGSPAIGRSSKSKKKRNLDRYQNSSKGSSLILVDDDSFMITDEKKIIENQDDFPPNDRLDSEYYPVVVSLTEREENGKGLSNTGTWEDLHHSTDEEPPRQPSDVSRKPSRHNGNEKERLTHSGHTAGLQTRSMFGEMERALNEKNINALSSADTSLTGANADTVYRDKTGRKVDMVNEYLRKEAVERSKKEKIQRAQQNYGRGTVQKEQAIQKLKEIEDFALEPFARAIDDPKLEAWKKEVIHEDDPMAEYFREKLKSQVKIDKNSRSQSSIPQYNGPNVPVNRFMIRPGYRWDGVDRGNHFEERVLNSANTKMSFKENQYKWSVADM